MKVEQVELNEDEIKTIIYSLKKSLKKSHYELLERLKTDNRIDVLRYEKTLNSKILNEIKDLGYIVIVGNRLYETEKSPLHLMEFFERLIK